jgi:hypothetical protein
MRFEKNVVFEDNNFMILRLTSKMSHARGRHDSCRLRFRNPLLHSTFPSLERGMTDVVVGSGALLGRFGFAVIRDNIVFRDLELMTIWICEVDGVRDLVILERE